MGSRGRIGLRLAGLGQFGAQLVDLAAIGVVKVFDALFAMDALTLDIGPGPFTLRGYWWSPAA